MKKKIIISIILIIALLILFGVIFKFSSQNGKTSGALSKLVTQKIIEILKKLPNYNDVKNNLTVSNLEYLLRKLAHFSLYMLGGLLLMSLMNVFTLKDKFRILISLGIGLLYAISDEIHQMFVPGRDARITDVMIDTMGVIIGIIIIIKIKKIILKNKSKKELV